MTDAPTCNVRDRAGHLFEVDSLDLKKCHSFEINTALQEHELQHPGLAHRMETWPPDVRRRIHTLLDAWLAEHTTFAIRLVSSGMHNGVAVVILHYALK